MSYSDYSKLGACSNDEPGDELMVELPGNDRSASEIESCFDEHVNELSIDQQLARLRYEFWKLSPYQRLAAAYSLALIEPDLCDKIPLELFARVLHRAIELGSAQRLMDECVRRNELEKEPS